MFCENCGAPLSDGANYCRKCGVKIIREELYNEKGNETINLGEHKQRRGAWSLIAVFFLVLTVCAGLFFYISSSKYGDTVMELPSQVNIDNKQTNYNQNIQSTDDAELEKQYTEAETLLDNGEIAKAAITFSQIGAYKDAKERSIELWAELNKPNTISAGWAEYTLWINTDGTVAATGDNTYKQCDVGSWTDIIEVDSSTYHSVGIKSNGTVVATGYNTAGQCNVSNWENIIDISAGLHHTVALESDGTVIATGQNSLDQCNVEGWNSIVAVGAGHQHTVGLTSNGTVVAAGSNLLNQCDINTWSNIVNISAGALHTIGLKDDGTVVAVGSNLDRQCNVQSWENIIDISAGAFYTVGLKSDGTVVAIGDNKYGQCDVTGWNDIVAISAGYNHTIGVKSDGTVLTAGSNEKAQCNIGDNAILTVDASIESNIRDKQTGTTNNNSGSNTNKPSTNSARHDDQDAWVCAKAIVKNNLKSPSTAKFCSFTDAEVKHLGNGEYMVTGWVDAQNSLGAVVREYFVVTYTATPDGYKNGVVLFS